MTITLRRLLFVFVAFATLIPLSSCEKPTHTETTQTIQTETRFEALPSAAVTGKIETPEGFEPRGIMVYAEGTSHVAVTNLEGQFTISGLPADFYSFRAMSMGLEPLTLAQVTIREPDLNTIVDLGTFSMKEDNRFGSLAFGPTGSIRGRVVTTDPADAADVLVRVVGTEIGTSTDPSGGYVLVNVPEGETTLRFTRVGYAPATANTYVTAGEETFVEPVRLRYNDPAVIGGRTILGTVRMLDQAGKQMTEYGTVTVRVTGTDYRAVPDGQGNFQITGLPAELLTVGASAPGFLASSTTTVDLRALNAAEIELVLRIDPDSVPPLGTILGFAFLKDRDGVSPQPGVSVTISGTSFFASTDAAGLYQITGIPDGTYSIMASFDGYKTAQAEGVQLASDQILELRDLILEHDVEYPKVIATTPEDGERDVTITDTTDVVITFSKPMNPQTVVEAISVSPDVEFTVYADSGHPLASEGRTVVALEGYTRQGVPLKFDKTYRIEVADSAEDRDGNPLEEAYAFKFRTGRAKIVRTLPRDGAKNVFVGFAEPVRVYFNAAIDLEGFQADRVRIDPQIPTQPQIYMENDPDTGWATMSIAGQFDFDEEYEIQIRSGIQTLGGDRISNIPYRFSFTTTEAREADFNTMTDDERSQRLEEERERRK